MSKIKSIYQKIEQFSKNRPALFWLITVITTSIPFISFWKQTHLFLKRDFQLRGYELMLFILIPFVIIILSKIFKPSIFTQHIIKDLESIRTKLNNPFELDKVSFNNVKYTEKYYHSEIVECYDDYNNIVNRLKNKNPDKFQDLKLRDNKPRRGKDWVHYSEMQVIKSDVISLINRLK